MSTAVALPPFHQFREEVFGVSGADRWAQTALSKAIDGLPLDELERALVEKYTARDYIGEAVRQVVILVGRQSGKTEMAVDRLVYEAVAASLEGDRGVACIGVAQDSRSAVAVMFGYVLRRFEHPMLKPMIVAQTADTITLSNDVVIAVLPCRPAALRGRRCRIVVCDEFAHFRNSENIALDREIWRAALPSLLTTGGRMFLLSSPYAASGLAYDLHKAHYGVAGSPILVWQSPGVVLHPTLDAEFMQQLRDADPEGARAELDGEFLSNRSALIDEEMLSAAVDEGIAVRPPEPGVQYAAFMDWATGSKAGNDAATVAIGHRTKDGGAVLDAVQAWAPPFSVARVASEASEICGRYRVDVVIGDRFAAGFSEEACRSAGLTYRASAQDKSQLYCSFASGVNSGLVRLLDAPDLLREIRGLERRRTATRDKVDHRPGAHDDRANAAAGVIEGLLKQARGGSGEGHAWWL